MAEAKTYSPQDAEKAMYSIATAMREDKDKGKLEFSITNDVGLIVTYKNGGWLAVDKMSASTAQAVEAVNYAASKQGVAYSKPVVIPELGTPNLEKLDLREYPVERAALNAIVDGKTFPNLKDITISAANLSAPNADKTFADSLANRTSDFTLHIKGVTRESIYKIKNGHGNWEHAGGAPFPQIKNLEETFRTSQDKKNSASNLSPETAAAVAALGSSGVLLHEPSSMPIGNYAPNSPKTNGLA